MSNKRASAWHGARCDGACCRTNKHLGVCPHSRVCQHHLKEDAARIKRETEESARIEFAKAWLR